MQWLFQFLYCIGSFVLLHSEFVGGLIDGATPLFVEHCSSPHFDFTNFPISYNVQPSSSALLLEFALARDFSLFIDQLFFFLG